jgi:hypothetical protein
MAPTLHCRSVADEYELSSHQSKMNTKSISVYIFKFVVECYKGVHELQGSDTMMRCAVANIELLEHVQSGTTAHM